MIVFQFNVLSNLDKCKLAISNSITLINNSFNNLKEDELYELKLIFNELIINALKHGNKNNEEKNINVLIKINKNIVYGKISDESYNKETFSKFKNNKPNLNLEHNRGICIVNNIADHLTYVNNSAVFVKLVNCYE